jgi:serine/threonine protein kinase
MDKTDETSVQTKIEETVTAEPEIPASKETEPDMVLHPGGDDPTLVNIPAGASASSSQAAKSALGEFVINNRFVLEERLGKGGQGQIYKARDLRKEEAQDDDPYVAIKFLGEEFSRHPMALISLQREAKKSQQLAHPNILTVYDFDRDGDRVYMTMEMLQGAPLSKWKSLEFDVDMKPTVVALIEQMASGLAYAHDHGLVHSDFKPDNVFVTTDGRVKVLDFGIARIVDSAVEKDSFDAGDLGALTVRYASLEMLQGNREPHPSDDVYALGLVAYQLYTGEHPYGGKNAEEALALGLIADPIKEIKRHQWRAISHAIALKREDRTESAELFWRQFAGSSVRNKVLLVAVVVLALSSAFFGYQSTLREGPAVAFTELPASVQTEFNESMAKGQASAAIEDWDGASRYFISAYDLHPRNPDAEEGLELLAQHLVTIAPTLDKPRQQKYLLSMLQAYTANEYLANHEALNVVKANIQVKLGVDEG